MAYLLGFILGIFYIKFLNSKHKLDLSNDLINDFFFYTILGVILGGRIGYILLYNPAYYFYNPIEIIKVWNGGMAFHGGLIGVIISTLLFSLKNKSSFFIFSDLLACAAPIGIFFGRIANFINGELVGRITDKKIGIIFSHVDNAPRHPSQIYEAILEGLLLFFILLFYQDREKFVNRSGLISSLFLIFYSSFRFISEYFREPDMHLGLQIFNLSLGQIYSIFFLFIGIIIFLKK
ncbi:MAG: Prolipoprotein diacylglyceryl transferase [Alphaproteobacteria bacterium MarineAlpha6_Bin4]|nr:MAG: Prolipoprotein diacylglyceryl transferase [Alphaproteobacteria bacterium MarineAlpha6_Bin3]PPR37376.1 MAG: Prolipoprotein diacylglyceryl transferase [Alphaproteobacteria bacterium MarineAlpha6_Bin4]|tara:strand:+ start:5455 stop:6159 length:705 start_codon:yes stop_codon:yes gene_type:complete